MAPSSFDRAGSIHLDARGGARALRVSWHHEAGLVVLSLWRDNVCSASFRLAIDEVPDLVDALVTGLASAYDEVRERERPRRPDPWSASPLRSDSLGMSTTSSRHVDSVRSWTRSETPTRPAPANDLLNWPVGTNS